MAASGNITVVGVKLGSVIANLASIASFSLYIAERTSTLPTKSGLPNLNVVLHLAILTAIAFGVIWTLADLIFGCSFGAGGGDRLPAGWSAVVLSLSMTVPLAFIPFLYQKLTGGPPSVAHALESDSPRNGYFDRLSSNALRHRRT